MPFLDISIGGLDGALDDLRDFPILVEKMSLDAIQATAKATKTEASRLTRQKYAISADDLDQYISLTSAKSPQGGASVTLMARPLPLRVFRPTVKMQTFTLTSTRGRTYTRKLPTVYIKRFTKGAAKRIPGYFPLHQRSNGALSASDRVARRVGGTKVGRTVNGHTYEGNKLTGVRYYTFPKSFLAQIKPQLVEFVGERGSIELRGAFRIQFKGQRVLRGPR